MQIDGDAIPIIAVAAGVMLQVQEKGETLHKILSLIVTFSGKACFSDARLRAEGKYRRPPPLVDSAPDTPTTDYDRTHPERTLPARRGSHDNPLKFQKLGAVFLGRTEIFRIARPFPDFPRTELRGVWRHSAARRISRASPSTRRWRPRSEATAPRAAREFSQPGASVGRSHMNWSCLVTGESRRSLVGASPLASSCAGHWGRPGPRTKRNRDESRLLMAEAWGTRRDWSSAN
jgi:hypothetical protein